MRTGVTLSLIFGLVFMVAGLSLASAVERQRPGPTPTAPTRTKAVALTEGECTGLGGTVETAKEAACGSTGKKCVTVDKNGVIHSACITRR